MGQGVGGGAWAQAAAPGSGQSQRGDANPPRPAAGARRAAHPISTTRSDRLPALASGLSREGLNAPAHSGSAPRMPPATAIAPTVAPTTESPPLPAGGGGGAAGASGPREGRHPSLHAAARRRAHERAAARRARGRAPRAGDEPRLGVAGVQRVDAVQAQQVWGLCCVVLCCVVLCLRVVGGGPWFGQGLGLGFC
jgi:hypothetical protein